MKTIITIPHDGYMLTIAEVIEAIESVTTAKIVQITEMDGSLAFCLAEPEPEPEPEQCRGCDGEGPLSDEGYCSHCMSDIPF